ncbi:MAG TPA: DMT family transporter [Dongiaceae bacterium]|jgi:drug/metabolite transporter (DMT)-like permease|nr:DMT family transporter [Dongiaceae bacterium]
MNGQPLAAAHQAERTGYVMVFWAAVFWSTGGFFVRLIPLDLWTLLGWRSLFGVTAVLVFALWQQGALHFRALATWHGLIATLCAGIGMICFVVSNALTSVANVAVLYATLPFMTAGLAWAWIGERPSRRTLIASAAALLGVVVMARGSIGGGHLLGDVIAILLTLLTAILTVTVRRHRDTPILEAVIAGGVLVLAMAVGMALGAPADVGPLDLGWLALFGALTMGGGMALYTVGARRVPSAQAALLAAVETPLAPLWVWLAFAEVPPATTFIGGGLILAALAWHFVGELRAA